MRLSPFLTGCVLTMLALYFAAQLGAEPVPTKEDGPIVLEGIDIRQELEVTAETPEATVPEEEEAKEPEPLDPVEVELIGRTIWGEADGVKSKAERAAVAWCILNRVDARGQTIEEVVTAPEQFKGYRTWGECPQRHLDLAADVLTRWNAEKEGAEDVGRVLPAEYQYFIGDGKRNHFSIEWRSTDYWDWSLFDPYITQ